MKKRLLPFGFFLLILGLAFMSISAVMLVGDKIPGNDGAESEYLAKIRNNQHNGQLPAGDVLAAREQVVKNDLFKSANADEYSWNIAGPTNLGGRTRAILFDNQDATGNTILAGSVTGGMFKTLNAGFSWSKINLSTGNLHVSCITQSSSGAFYVGTGEGFTNDSYSVLGEWGYSDGFLGEGIFKSTDGENFSLLSSTKPSINANDELEWGFINELAAAPSGEILYAATNTGLKFSSDGGSSWVTAKADDTELSMNSMDVKVGSNGLVIAVVGGKSYVSDDGDPNNFTMVSGDSTWNLPGDNIGRMEFAIAPSDPSVLYALAVNASGALLNVYSSEDGGMTWRIIGPGSSASFNLFNTGSNIGTGSGIYACSIEVFPTNPGRVVVSGLNMWEGVKVTADGFFDWQMRSDALYGPAYAAYLPENHHIYKFIPGSNTDFFVGTNAGIYKGTYNSTYDLFTFQGLNKNYTTGQFYAMSYSSMKNVLMGGGQDLGSIYIDGNTFASDPKRGEQAWSDANGFPDGATGTFCSLSLIAQNISIYSRVPHPAKEGNLETFVRRNEYIGGPNFAAPDRMFDDKYASTAFLSPFVLWESFEDYNSRDSVKVMIYSDIPAGFTGPVESQNAGRVFFYTTPVALSAGDSIMVQDIVASKFFIGGNDRVMMTKEVLKFDRIPEWYTIANTTSGFEGTPQCLAYSADANHLFVGTLEGGLYRMSNIAYAWNFERADVSSPYCVIATTKIPIYLPGTQTEISQVVTSVAVNPNNANQVIITLGNYGNEHYVYMTDNALDEIPEFHSIQGDPNNGGLPQMPAYSSLFEMNPDNHLVFVGTEYGVYVSDNVQSANPTWVAENNTIGRVPVFMLKQQIVRKESDTLVIINNDTTTTVYPGVDNYGVIYGATFGRGLIRLDEFQKPVGIFNPGNTAGSEMEFNIYPNPATDRTRVEFTLTASNKVDITVYDLTGKQVLQNNLGHMPSGKHQVELSVGNLPTGTYLVQLRIGNESSSGKIIIY